MGRISLQPLDKYRSINAAAESLNSLYKKELIDYHGDWESVIDVTIATMDWVHWYNNERIHSYTGGISPAQYEEWFNNDREPANVMVGSQAK